MKDVKLSSLVLIPLLTATMLTSGCSSTPVGASHRPIIDGNMDSRYEADLQECQTLADRRNYINGNSTQNTLVGAVAGGVLAHNPLRGALLGAAVAATGSTLSTRGERRNIVINCMTGRGYKTLESTSH